MGWQRFNLGDLYKIGSSKRVLKSQWETKGVPFYRGREVTILSKFGSVENSLFISEKLYQEYSNKHGVPEADDIVVTAIGTIGNSYIVRENDRFYFKDASILWLKRVSGVNSSFINLWLKSPLMKEQLDEGNGATVDTLTIKKLKSLQVDVPPIPEQQRIVAILDQAFSDIEKARANAEQNLKNARELFDSYLDTICSSKSSLPSRLIGDVCSLYQGIAINKKSKHLLVEKSSLPLLRIKDLKNNREEQYVSEEGYPVNSRVFEDDILYTRTGSLGLVFRGRNGVLHNNSFKVVPNDSIDKNYLFWWLQHASFKKEIMRLALKAAQPDITHAIFKIQTIEIPLLGDQKKWVENIERQKIITDDLAVIYKSKLLALDELKKSLLQKAFSGELTKDKDIAA